MSGESDSTDCSAMLFSAVLCSAEIGEEGRLRKGVLDRKECKLLILWEGSELPGIHQVICPSVTQSQMLHLLLDSKQPSRTRLPMPNHCCKETSAAANLCSNASHNGGTFDSSSCSFCVQEEAVCRRQTRRHCRAQAPGLLCCIARVLMGSWARSPLPKSACSMGLSGLQTMLTSCVTTCQNQVDAAIEACPLATCSSILQC